MAAFLRASAGALQQLCTRTRARAATRAPDRAVSRRHSLRVELAAALALVLMMAVVSLALAGEWLARRRHEANEDQRLRDHTRGLALLLAPRVAGGTPAAAERAEVEQALRPSIGSLGIVAIELHRIADAGSQQVLSLGLAPDGLPAVAVGDTVEDALAAVGEWSVVDRPLRSFGARAPQSKLVLRVVGRRAPWTTSANWGEIAVLALGVGVISFVLGVGLLELQVLRPLAQLQRGVRAVAGGDLDVRVATDGPAELRDFAAALDDMTARLAARQRELAEQRDRLVRAEQLASIGRIAAGTAHEVGNPLATILGYVELLLDPRQQPPLDDEARSMLERVREQLLRIRNLVAQLLDYSRATRVDAGAVPLRPLCERLVALLQHDPRCAGVTLAVAGQASACALADASKLEQVLVNLVVNGARAAREAAPQGRVELRVAAAERDVTIEVQDTGRGIAPQIRERLFEPFVTTAKAGEGTGLGLATSAGLIEAMEGSLVCLEAGARPPLREGDSPGAVFRVTLRAAEPASNPDGGAAVQATHSAPPGP